MNTKKVYSNGDLVESYVFIYPKTNQIRVENILRNDNSYEIYFLYSNKNIVTIEYYRFNSQLKKHELTSKINNTFDNKNNPFNIIGFNYFIVTHDTYYHAGKNNLLTSSGYNYNYSYNEQGYPTSIQIVNSNTGSILEFNTYSY